MGPALACHHARAPSFLGRSTKTKTDTRTPLHPWVMAAPMRQRAPPPEVHSQRWATLKSDQYLRAAWATSGTAPGDTRLAGAVSGWSDASQLPPKAEDRSSSDMRDARMLPSFCDSEIRPTDTMLGDNLKAIVKTSRGQFRTSRQACDPSPGHRSSCCLPPDLSDDFSLAHLASSRCVTTRVARAVAPHQWRVRRLLTRLRGSSCAHGGTALVLRVATSALGVPAPASFLVLNSLTEATTPCTLLSLTSSRGHGPLLLVVGCPGRPCPLRTGWPVLV
jgi:hypothetical protein